MNKLATRLLVLVCALVMAFGLCAAHAEEAPAEAAEAWLLYFASNHETDSANWPWWPQHQRIDQPASETGVEYTNAVITGPGYYTVGLKFTWQQAEGAIQFNLILDDAERLFPGYYCEITDIRVNNVSIPVSDNLYGTYHDDPDSGMVSIYNSYWDTKWEPNAGGPDGHRAWDNEDKAHWLIINPDDIVDGNTIEVDFFFAEKAGEKPAGGPALRVISDNPIPGNLHESLASLSGVSTQAWLNFADSAWWPQRTEIGDNDSNKGVTGTNATINGEGAFTVGLSLNKYWHTNGANGSNNTYIVIEDGEKLFPGSYVQITDIRLNGESVPFENNLTVPLTWDGDNPDKTSDDTAIPIAISWMNDTDHNGWNRREWGDDATCLVLDPALIKNMMSIEIDFILAGAKGAQPAEPMYEYEYHYYPNNTMGVAGFSLRDDLGIGDKWYNVVPVDLTADGIQKISLVASNMYVIGEAIVTVEGDNVTVTYEPRKASPGSLTVTDECVKWFKSVDEITPEFIANPTSDMTFGQTVSKAELGDVALLFIRNGVSYMNPVTNDGVYLPRYMHNSHPWIDARSEMQSLMDQLGGAAE